MEYLLILLMHASSMHACTLGLSKCSVIFCLQDVEFSGQLKKGASHNRFTKTDPARHAHFQTIRTHYHSVMLQVLFHLDARLVWMHVTQSSFYTRNAGGSEFFTTRIATTPATKHTFMWSSFAWALFWLVLFWTRVQRFGMSEYGCPAGAWGAVPHHAPARSKDRAPRGDTRFFLQNPQLWRPFAQSIENKSNTYAVGQAFILAINEWGAWLLLTSSTIWTCGV